jgi:hypothetical protein
MERGLVKLSLIPQAETGFCYCDDLTLRIFLGCLRADKNFLLGKLFKDITTVPQDSNGQDVDVWFEVYRSVSGGPQGGGDTEEDRRRQRKVERRR